MIRFIRTIILVLLSLLCLYSGYSQTSKYTDFLPSVYQGSTVIDSVYSPSLEGNLQGNPTTQPVKVYLPPGYDTYSDNKYPVVYLLHGYTQEYNRFDSYGLSGIFYDLISNKTIVPMIIVTPNAKTIYDGSFYTNSYVSGNWEDYIVQDVIQFIENKYRIPNQAESRGLSGFSMGGYGTTKIAMKHPSLINSIVVMGGAALDLEVTLNHGLGANKENMKTAAGINQYRTSDPWGVRVCFADAVARAPDSTAIPVLGRLPFDAEGVRNDSIWQKWLEHDPFTMLPTYKDSLLKLNAFQIYIGDNDGALAHNESFHQALIDHGIEHGFQIYSGVHDPSPVLDDMLIIFSEQLERVVPTLRSSSDYYLESAESFIAETDMDATLYVVPAPFGMELDSIMQHWLLEVDALANEEMELLLSDLEFGKYNVFAIRNDILVSNIPAEFCVVPDPSPPVLNIDNTNVVQGDSIGVSMSRDGIICLVEPDPWLSDTLRAASDILNTFRLIGRVDAPADSEVSFSSDDLSAKIYWIYGFDQYGIVTGPKAVEVVPVGISINKSPEIILFPNPVSKIANIHLNTYARCEIEISSLNSQLIRSEEMEGTTHQIDLSSFQKGVYFITIRSKDFITTKKIIKL